MGLDMYLEGSLYFGGNFNEKDETIVLKRKAVWEKEEKILEINVKDISDIKFRLAYWRKANAIHKWFVDHCFNGVYDDYQGEDIDVSKEQLIELKELCKKVLEELEGKTYEAQKEIIANTLPMQKGFFFGYNESEDGIECYIYDLENTIKQIDDAIKKCEKYDVKSIVYNASW